MISPFDAAARTYDDDFTQRQPGRWLRDHVRRQLPFEPGQHVLELGCGTGEDAVWLASNGCHVSAVDASSAMLNQARNKALARGHGERISFHQIDLNQPSALPITAHGILANFGVINCVHDLHQLRDYMAQHLHPGGSAALVVMGPVCAWEIAWHGLHLKPAQALRRLRSQTRAHAGKGYFIDVHYPSPRQLSKALAPAFTHQRTIAIGTLLPPSYLADLVERWPRVFTIAEKADRKISTWWPFTHLSDHYLAIFRKH